METLNILVKDFSLLTDNKSYTILKNVPIKRSFEIFGRKIVIHPKIGIDNELSDIYFVTSDYETSCSINQKILYSSDIDRLEQKTITFLKEKGKRKLMARVNEFIKQHGIINQ